MADFLTAYKITVSNEGNILTNDPNDSGGLSYGGISRKNNPNWEGWKIIEDENLSVGESLPVLDNSKQEWYRTHYWIPIKGDEISDQDLANQVFDMAVNGGVGEAIKLLKQA